MRVAGAGATVNTLKKSLDEMTIANMSSELEVRFLTGQTCEWKRIAA